MAVFRTVIRSDLQKPLVVQQLSGNMFTADNASNEIAVEVTNGGEPVALSGAVTAYAVRADGVTAMFSGTISGNVASVILPASCYVEVGTLSIVVKVGTTTVGACTCYVYRTTTDEIVDPGHVIPSIDELLEQIDACRTATTNANTAATNANTAASNANTKAALADEKATLADQKATLANTAAQNADTKASLADTAATNANTKAGLANDAATLANTKAALADEKANLADTKATLANTAATNANTKAGLADTAAQNADAKATLANDAATLANTKAGLADTAATNANTAAGKIDNMTAAASGLPAGSAPVATITEVDGHKHIAFQIPKGDKGKDFHIAFTFASIAAMEAYSGDIELFDYAMIDTGNVQDVDAGKLYCYEQDEEWHYIGDLSGAQGIKGETGTGIDHVALNNDYTLTIYYDDGTQTTTTSIRGATGITPNIAIGTVTTLLPDQQAYVTRDPSSTAENPVFNFGIPKGDTGSASNVYGTTVPMSESDSTSVYNAIGSKLNKNQGTANAGKFMKVGANGELVPDTVPDPTGKADKVFGATNGNFAGLDASGNLTDSGKKAGDFLEKEYAFGFDSKTWDGFTNIDGTNIWTDGENIYYSYGQQQYVLDKSTGTWSSKTWNGTLTNFYGENIWFDGTHIYYSFGSQHHELVSKEGSYWYYKSWYGLDSFYESTIWTDGDNIYNSNGSEQRVLNRATSTWNTKTWNGDYSPSTGEGIWTDGVNIYYDSNGSHFILDKATSTWSVNTWNGFTDVYGRYIWTDGKNYYYSNGSAQYVLDRSTSTWSAKTWSGLSSFSGQKIWTDGDNYYFSSNSSQYVLDNKPKLYLGQDGEFASVPVKKFIDENVPAPDLSGKVDKNQGTENAGKFMKVGNDGNLVPDTVPDPTGKADKVQNATSGNFAGLDANGNLTDSGKKPSDFLTHHQDISGKADKVSGATNGNFAGLDANGNLTDSGKKPSDFLTQHQDISGKVDKNQGTENAGKALGINNQGQVVPVPFSGEDFTGATAASAGTHGYVPAPQITDMTKFLCGDGTWADVAGGKLVTFELDEVTGTGGSYGHITYISSVTHDMKAVLIEVSDPDVFLDEISISCMDGGIALSCNNVNGTSTVTVSCLFKANPDNITSSEFDVLSNRIGTLGNLQTNEKSNLVGAVNELSDNVAQVQDGLAIVANGDTHAAISSGQFVYVRNHDTLANGLYKASAAISANGALSTSNLTPDGSGGLNDLKSDIDTLSSKISDYKILKTIKSGTANSSGSLDTGMSVTTRIIVGIRPSNTTNSHYDFDAYGGRWWITGCPANTAVEIVILYVVV